MVGSLLLLAVAIPLVLKLYGPREMVMDLQGTPGGQIVWRFQSGLTTQTGITNVPVRLVFHAGQMEFTAHRTNYTGPLQLNVQIDGTFNSSASIGDTLGGLRFFHIRSGVSVTEGITGVP